MYYITPVKGCRLSYLWSAWLRYSCSWGVSDWAQIHNRGQSAAGTSHGTASCDVDGQTGTSLRDGSHMRHRAPYLSIVPQHYHLHLNFPIDWPTENLICAHALALGLHSEGRVVCTQTQDHLEEILFMKYFSQCHVLTHLWRDCEYLRLRLRPTSSTAELPSCPWSCSSAGPRQSGQNWPGWVISSSRRGNS